MKVSLNWLKEYTQINSIPSQIAEKLTMAGLEVESFNNIFDYLDNVVVAKIAKIEKHPMADKLTCCTVDIGNDLKKIVCGASNVKQDMLVPCALPGAVLPNGLKIKKSKLRGEVSEGMLCSAYELKLGSDKSGIMKLNSKLQSGTSLIEALGLFDYVFEIDITPNRPDCLSFIGVAREIAAFEKSSEKIQIPVSEFHQKQADCLINNLVKVNIIDSDLCPRYVAGLLVDVKVGPSPFWLQQKLESVGLTPINNIVDITNFVMLETGQPIHAFDYDFIAQHKIQVKKAGENLNFATLDGKEHILEPDMLMICDGEKPVAIAGVMGGRNSEIKETTTKVLVESAYFNPVSIRKTAKKLGITSDASYRFERGVDPDATKKCLKRAVALMAEISGACVAKGFIDENPKKNDLIEINLNIDFLNKRLGTDLSLKTIQELLKSIGFIINLGKKNSLMVQVPSFRVDVSRPEDLCEEVARLWGYNNIKTSFPVIPSKIEKLSPKIIFREKIREIMNGFGFSEALNYSFADSNSCNKLELGLDDKKRAMEHILNPISKDFSVLRTSLVPSLMENVKRNNSQQIETLKIFEIGNIFLSKGKGIQPKEKEMLAGLWTGAGNNQSWHFSKIECDFFDIKGVVEGLFQELNIDNFTFIKADERKYPYLKKGFSTIVKKDNKIIACAGQINDKVLKNFNVKQNVFVFEINMKSLLQIIPQFLVFFPLPKFPSISLDITLIVDLEIETGAISLEIDKIINNNTLIENVFLFDVYKGKQITKGKKSLSFRIVYRSIEKTLKEKQITKLHSKISKILVDKFKADLP